MAYQKGYQAPLCTLPLKTAVNVAQCVQNCCADFSNTVNVLGKNLMGNNCDKTVSIISNRTQYQCFCRVGLIGFTDLLVVNLDVMHK